MQDEIVFLSNHRGASVKAAVLIFGSFFMLVQLFYLKSEPLGLRISFTVAFVIFLLLGFWFSRVNSRYWPQTIIINRLGIRSSKMKVQYGVDTIPWNAVASMDLFYTNHRLLPHLRIRLRQGALRERLNNKLNNKFLQRISMGHDVNIPVSVNAAPEVVLQTAQQYWKAVAE